VTTPTISQNRTRDRICIQCGASFTVKYPSNKTKYCSRECVRLSMLKGNRCTCVNCGEKFTAKNYDPNARFCSKACWYAWHRDTNHVQFDQVTIKCEWCGKSFQRNKFGLDKSKHHYCSSRCSSKAHSLKMRGLHDGEPQEARYYTLAKWRKAREIALKRDNYRCVVCGTTSRQHHAQYGCGLHVDHIRPRRDGGSDNLDNLQSLCCVCHNKKTTAGK